MAGRMSSVLRAQMAAVHVTLNLFQGPDPAGWMLKPVQHDVIPAELNSFGGTERRRYGKGVQ